MPKVAIVYFSGYGHTARQAEAVRIGAQSTPDALVSVYRINETGDLPSGALEELSSADAFIYGSPTYMGGPAWQFKNSPTVPPKRFSRGDGRISLRRLYQLGLHQRRQIFDNPILLDVIAAARATVDRNRFAARQYEGKRARRSELDRRICRSAGYIAI